MFYLIHVLAAIQIGLPQIMGQQKFRMEFSYRFKFCYSAPTPVPICYPFNLSQPLWLGGG